MPPDAPLGRFRLLLLLLFSSAILTDATIRPRWSCHHHFLAGIRKSSVLPLRGYPGGVVSRVKCRIEAEGDVATEVHSALEKQHFVQEKRSVNFQIADLAHLRDIISSAQSQCTQTITVSWNQPPDENRGSFTVVSLLNSSMQIFYDPDEPVQKLTLDGLMAGVRHIIPDEDYYESAATLTASSLVCRQQLLESCLIRGKVEMDFEPNSDWVYEFAFRTDQANQTLVSLHTPDPVTAHIRLENDFFVRVDSTPPVAVGRLSDSQWHTIELSSSGGRVVVSVDSARDVIALNHLRLKTLEVKVHGDILLVDPTDVKGDCLSSFNQRRRFHETVTTHSMCQGCECSTLSHVFDRMSTTQCQTSDEHAFSLQRDPDRLSFLYVDDGLQMDANGAAIVQLSAAFKSDSDTGLVFFGFWQNPLLKGRFQVSFHFDRMTAVYCQHNGEEVCTGCSVRRAKGFGTDDWVRTALFGAGDELHLVVDDRICRLDPLDQANNISLAEVYSVPTFVHGNGVFVGGTFYEKKKRGLYKSDIEHRFFENTREKTPSLRGCVKEVFTKGRKLDLVTLYERQKKSMLVDSSDSTSFAVRFGCPACDPGCPDDVRCRFRAPLRPTHMICDCSDAQLFNNSYDTCDKTRVAEPIALSTSFLTARNIVLPVESTKAVLSKVWIKFTAPKFLNADAVIAEFNSHRESLFRIVLDTNGFLHVQLLPHDYDGSSAKRLDLSDDRVHMVVVQRRTPLGTRHNARKFDVFVDGWHDVVADVARLSLSNISVTASDSTEEQNTVILRDFGLAYDYDEHSFLLHPSNRIHQVDVHSMLLPFQFRKPELSEVGILDPSLWERPLADSLVGSSPESISDSQPSPFGQVVDYTPDTFEPEQLLSARWLIYSLILTVLLCLLILVCLICYSCVCRKKSLRRTSSGSDRVTILRDSPDYQPVKMRRQSIDTQSYDGDGSLGTDDTDLHAYRDIASHRVKIYRESMVSILVPSMDQQPSEAAIVTRSSLDVEAQDPPRPTPSPDSPAPLVNVNDD